MYKHNKHFRLYGNLKQVLYLLQLSFISINVSMKVSFQWVKIDLWLWVLWTEGRCSKIKLNIDAVCFVYKYIYLALGNFMNESLSLWSIWVHFICFLTLLFVVARLFSLVLTLMIWDEGGRYHPLLTAAWQNSRTPVRQWNRWAVSPVSHICWANRIQSLHGNFNQ